MSVTFSLTAWLYLKLLLRYSSLDCHFVQFGLTEIAVLMDETTKNDLGLILKLEDERPNRLPQEAMR